LAFATNPENKFILIYKGTLHFFPQYDLQFKGGAGGKKAPKRISFYVEIV